MQGTSFAKGIDTLLVFLEQLVALNENKTTQVVFHGGEPLAIGIRNWHNLLAAIARHSWPLEFCLQTNGTLLTPAYVSLFKQVKIDIGISLDGPPAAHNALRPFHGGRATHKQIMKAISRLRDADIKVGALVTFTRLNRDVDDLYRFFRSEHLSFDVRPVFPSAFADRDELSELLVSSNEYAAALCRLFDLWFDDEEQEAIDINDFQQLLIYLLNPAAAQRTCTYLDACCSKFIGFNLDGLLSPCNCFDSRKWSYGNINEVALSTVGDTPLFKDLSLRSKKLAEADCKQCPLTGFCHGGCPSNAASVYGDYNARDPFCGAYIELYRHAEARLLKSCE